MAEILRVDPLHPDRTTIARAAACIRGGGLVAFPTETVYGLGADAMNPAAVQKVFAAKGRPATDPLIVHVADLDAVRPLVSHVPDSAAVLAAAFWPGPLTLVLPRSSRIADAITGGLNTVAVRVPAHPVARALVIAADVPIAAPSANLFSRPSPTCAAHVADDLGHAIDFILDGGPTQVGLESTVLDLTADPPTVLRPGGIAVERLREVLPTLIVRTAAGSESHAMPAPGMLTRHYAPRTPLTLFEGEERAVVERLQHEARTSIRQGQHIVMLATREVLDAIRPALGTVDPGPRPLFIELGSLADLDALGAHLYGCLRDCDAAGAQRILAAQIPEQPGIALAVRDRLRRASAGTIVRC